MKKTILKRGIVFTIILLLLGAGIIPSITGIQSSKHLQEPEEMAVIQVGGNKQGVGGNKIEISLSQAEEIKVKLIELKNKIESAEITTEEFYIKILTLLRKENILPEQFTFDNLKKLATLLGNQIKNDDNNLLFSQMKGKKGFQSNKPTPNLQDMVNDQIHIGAGTIELSLTFGGTVLGFQIPFPGVPPKLFFESISQEINRLNFTEYIVINPHANLWIPTTPGYHYALSLIPVPGLEQYRVFAANGKAVFGLMAGVISIGIFCTYDTGEYDAGIFDLWISLMAADVIIAI